ncbi:hypothetical protein GPDM_03085 [Planococcus donghaensis MPA1U2]|uniref:Uncharacterized protein n=1 Tax=Planococcus donghaensis MPA1U2 TaxID=933115 RepID=E7RDT9_9BACL|nr:hypothetical protein [Planococcus donghaensis]EGA90845.1 hypothetical protein GPDM_03085 [Planococcus donghaensis MPA1U2]
MDNWFTDLYGKDAFKKMLEEFTEKELWDINIDGKELRVRISQQEGTLRCDIYDQVTGEVSDRIIPVGGFSLEQREKICQQAMEAAEAGLPIMWKEIISPMIQGYWDDEGWDVIKVHDIDRSKIDPNYRNYLKEEN